MNGYWARTRECFVKIPKATKVAVEGLDLFVHQAYQSDGYTVTEGRSGFALGPVTSKRKDAITQAKVRIEHMGLEKVLESIENSVKHSGLSPRYGGIAEAGVAIDALEERAIQNKKLLEDYASIFEKTFNTRLSFYWHPIFGFDVVKFDDDVIRSGECRMADKVIADYGEDAQKLIMSLL